MDIVRLADRPDVVPDLVRWFEDTWGPYYVEGPGDAGGDLRASCRRDGLPLALVALDGGEPVGTATLKAESVGPAGLGPWLAALVVPPSHRGRGIARLLVAAVEEEARRQGHDRLYVSSEATGLFRDWRAVAETATLRGDVPVFERRL